MIYLTKLYDCTKGILRVRVIEAKQLMKMDVSFMGTGKSDPYAIISVGSQEFRTRTINNSINPKWDFLCEVTLHRCEAPECNKRHAQRSLCMLS